MLPGMRLDLTKGFEANLDNQPASRQKQKLSQGDRGDDMSTRRMAGHMHDIMCRKRQLVNAQFQKTALRFRCNLLFASTSLRRRKLKMLDFCFRPC